MPKKRMALSSNGCVGRHHGVLLAQLLQSLTLVLQREGVIEYLPNLHILCRCLPGPLPAPLTPAYLFPPCVPPLPSPPLQPAHSAQSPLLCSQTQGPFLCLMCTAQTTSMCKCLMKNLYPPCSVCQRSYRSFTTPRSPVYHHSSSVLLNTRWMAAIIELVLSTSQHHLHQSTFSTTATLRWYLSVRFSFWISAT